MLKLLLCLSVVGLASSMVYLILVIVASFRFRQTVECAEKTSLPPVSLLKPLHGLEPFLERNLESFFQQDYPEFEIIFGARDSHDPALSVVRSLQARYPRVRT